MVLFRKLCLYLRPSSLLSPVTVTVTVSRNTTFVPSIYRLFSIAAAETEGPPPTSTSEFAVSYLIQSCGLPSDKATRLSRYISRLKSPEKPDAVLQFLRQAGISQPHIRDAALRNPSFLCFSVDKRLKPRISELLEMGLSLSHISLLFSLCPRMFSNAQLSNRIRFWIQILGSVDKLLLVLKKCTPLLSRNPETSAVCNISFLQEQCNLNVRQIVLLMMSAPWLIFYKPEALEIKAKRADELGISRSAGIFVNALIVVSCLSQSTIDRRLHYLRSLGLSQDEVSLMISKFPTLLTCTEKTIGHKMEFLLNEAACDKLHVVRCPALLGYSFKKRLIPRNIVRKLLHLKGLSVANRTFYGFVVPSEEKFVSKFVLPYEPAIPGLHQAYIDACAGKTVTIE